MNKIYLSFEDLQNLCRYHEVGCEDGEYIDTCRKKDCIPDGCSWGKCDFNNCPLLKKGE